MMQKKVIIFDFDGTLADTLPHIIALVNKNADKYGIKQVTNEELKHFQNISAKKLLQELHIPFYKLPFFIVEMQSLLKNEMENVALFPGIKDILLQLKKFKLSLGIISSNAKENIEIFLKKHMIDACFDFIHSEKNIFGKHKALQHIIDEYHFKKEDIIYIGDEVRDIEACKKINIPIVSVTWGFNSVEILKRFHPSFLVQTREDLLKLLMKLCKTT